MGTMGMDTLNHEFPPKQCIDLQKRMTVTGFKFQLPEIFLYFPANIYILVCTNTKSVEGVTWDMEGWLGLPLEEH